MAGRSRQTVRKSYKRRATRTRASTGRRSRR